MNKFEDMKAFIRIVEAGSITKASEQLNIAKSALSKRLSSLESNLGITLLNRTTRSQQLTDNGTAYYQQCKRIIDDVTELESTLQNKHCALHGSIKATVPLSFGLSHLTPAITQFNQIHPNINFELDFNDNKIAIIKEGYDLAIRIGQLDDSNLMARKITAVKTLLVASPDYLDKYGTPITPEQLSGNHVKLQYSNASSAWHFIDTNEVKKTIHLPIVHLSNNGDYLCQAAVEGQGILSTPDFICHEHIRSGQLIPILTDYYVASNIGVYTVYPPTRHLNRRVRTLIDFLAGYFSSPNIWDIDLG